MKALITHIINSPLAAFHSEGLKVYPVLEKAFLKGEDLLVSFEGINRCTTQFLNASVGKLYMKYDPRKLNSLISFADYSQIPHFSDKLEEVKSNAISSKEYDNLIESATS
jgi:hypothetical protein